MKSIRENFKNICPASKIVIKWGTILALTLILCAFFSFEHKLDMCSVSVYLFAESIIAGLLFDVISKRIN